MLRVGTIKCSSFDSMMKNLNTTTTNAHNSKVSRCVDQTLFDWWTNLKLKLYNVQTTKNESSIW